MVGFDGCLPKHQQNKKSGLLYYRVVEVAHYCLTLHGLAWELCVNTRSSVNFIHTEPVIYMEMQYKVH